VEVATPIIHLDHYLPLEHELSYGYEDLISKEILNEVGVEIPEGYGIVRACDLNVRNSLKKGDRAEVYLISSEDEKMAESYLENYFGDFLGKFYPTSVENIKLTPNASAGFPFKMSKRDCVWEHFDYLREYCKRGVPDRPCPIWKVTPKVEYLTRENINNHKIRLFRNPPIDYLCLEKVYFQTQDDELLRYGSTPWSMLGFMKENGGWDHLMTRHLKFRYHYMWDVGFWDKGYGPRLDAVVERVRRKFYALDADINVADLDFLWEQACFAYELYWDGWVCQTSLDQKSGRLRTSTNNTIAHIYLLFVHYLRVCRKLGLKPSYAHCMSSCLNSVYSDDIMGSTDDPRFVQKEDLEETFKLVGMEIKDYHLTEDISEIRFLGAQNAKWTEGTKTCYVPKYDCDRMMYAVLVLGGRITDRERAERILGLVHNLCFSERADAMAHLIERLRERGLWPDDLPVPTLRDARRHYLAYESFSGRSCNTGEKETYANGGTNSRNVPNYYDIGRRDQKSRHRT